MQYIIGTITDPKQGFKAVDMKDDIVRQSLVSFGGQLLYPPPPIVASASELA